MPRFYASDVRRETWKVFKSCMKKKVVVTSMPEVIVRPFVQEYLGGDEVLGTELEVDNKTGKATGFIRSGGVSIGDVRKTVGEHAPVVGLWGVDSGHRFMDLCKVIIYIRGNDDHLTLEHRRSRSPTIPSYTSSSSSVIQNDGVQ